MPKDRRERQGKDAERDKTKGEDNWSKTKRKKKQKEYKREEKRGKKNMAEKDPRWMDMEQEQQAKNEEGRMLYLYKSGPG